MTTTAYRNIRACIQLFSVFLIIINIPLLIILIANIQISNIETENLQMGFASLTNMYKISIISNITLGMFASCGVNSKTKLYMRFYIFFTFIYLMLFIACILYVKKFYLKYLINAFNMKAASPPIRYTLEFNLSCTLLSRTCEESLKRSTYQLRRFFLLGSFVSLVLHILSIILVKFALEVKIEKPEIKLPKIITVTKAGMNTQSLRRKKVIEKDGLSNKSICV